MLVTTLLVAGAIDTAPPYAVAAPAPPASAVLASGACLPVSVMRDATVVVLGAYTGAGPQQPFGLEGTSHPLRTVGVTGTGKDKVVLVLTAYEPILWNLAAVAGRVRGVVAAGHHPQAVKGLRAGTPVVFTNNDASPGMTPACRPIRLAYHDTLGARSVAIDVTNALGRHPRRFFGRYSADSLPIDPIDPTRAAADMSDVRAPVPLVAREDLNPGSAIQPATPLDDRAGGSALKAIEWDASGTIIRDTGGREAAERQRPAGDASRYDRESPSWAPPPPRRARSAIWSTLTTIWWVGWIAAIVFALSQWLRSRRPERHDVRAAPATVVPAPAPPPADAGPIVARPALEERIADLTEIAALTDSQALVVALHRYGREVQNLHRSSFDADLADEINAIMQRHFAHAVARYRQVRRSLDGGEADRADETLTHAIERLVARLQELHREQHARDVAGVDEAARFIDARHPG